jgi:HD-GYP domain-containing protein (c-di-GMP phosphodiesterase class II)/HAMP domain-containing protein
VSIKSRIGLRGKLSIIIILTVVTLSAVLTFLTSSYLSNTINSEYIHRAQAIASFLESSFANSQQQQLGSHMQNEINALMPNNPEVTKISVYAPTAASGSTPADNNITTIASSEQAAIGINAGESDTKPIYTNETMLVEEKEEGEQAAAESESQSETKTLEMIAPLHDTSGQTIGSVGIYLDATPRDSLIFNQQMRFAIITNLGLLCLLVVLYISLNRLFINPVKQLTRATQDIGFTDWVNPVGVNRNDEIGNLARAFDDMTSSLNTRDEEVKLLLEASVAVSSALHVDKILQILCEKIAASRKVTYCRISLFDKISNSLVVKAASPTREIADWDFGIGDEIDLSQAHHHAGILESMKPEILRRDGQISVEGTETEWEWALTPNTQSALLLPLIAKNKAIGVVTLGEVRHWDRTPFSAKKIEFYQTLMNQAAVAIENAQLYEKTEWHVRELSAVHNMSQAFTSTLDYQEVISVVAQRVGNPIGAQFASVLLPDDNGRHLNIVASYNLSAEYVWTINKKRRIPVGVGPLGMAFTKQMPFKVTNTQMDQNYEFWRHVASVQGYSSLIALPLLSKGESIGVICIYFAEPREFKQDEIELLTTASNEAAIAIENARIYENLEDAFVGTIRSLAETIDAKDTYTRGHSEQVSLYAEAIARGLGLEGDELQTIRYAGYLHDVGKIGIPDAILSKPGKLTVEEFGVIKKHPILSERILKPVNFPYPVQSIVRHHHERFDGKGYPDHLAGEEIPLGARILFVADAFEAMTSDRPYRKALSNQMAIDELQRNMGTQFDERIVSVFSKIINTDGHSRSEVRLEA